MLNKGQLFKDVMVVLLIIWVIIVSICILDLYDIHHYLEYSIDVLEESVGDLYDYINSAKGIWL